MFEYSRSADPTRESAEKMSKQEADVRCKTLFDFMGYRVPKDVLRAFRLTH
jgi:hypothetical protein